MKDYKDVMIFCKCSAKMHTQGKHFQHHEFSQLERKCPNCGKLRPVMEEVKDEAEKQ